MATLLDYLDAPTLKQLAKMFSDASGSRVRITGSDGATLAVGGPRGRGKVLQQAPVALDAKPLGTVIMEGRSPCPGAPQMLLIMADVLARLCRQAQQLRERMEELTAIYRVTEVFAGKHDLRELHQLAAQTIAQVTGADACSIRVLSEDRRELLTMAAWGLSRRYMGKGPIRVERSAIDRQVLESGQPVYIRDERADPRVLYKAEARREGIVSALCVPMTYKGRHEGVVRVYTKRVHQFDWFETSLIRGVAAQAASALANARLYGEALEAENIRRQLRLAAEVQRRMIPPAPPQLPGLDIAAIYVPCFELGGDFYDFIELPNDNWGLAAADVVGKGVRASLLMASAKASLRAHAAHLYDMDRVLAAVNLDICRQSQEGDFLTMFYGVLDVPRRRLTWCSAGHEPALLLRDAQAQPLAGAGAGGVLGMDPRMSFGHSVLQLRAGDALLLSTDGLPEALNFQEEVFGRRRTRESALAAWGRGDSAEGIARHVLWEMRRFCGLQTRCDDLTLVVVKVL